MYLIILLCLSFCLRLLYECWTDDVKCPERTVGGDDVLLRDCEGNSEPRRKDCHYKGMNNSTSLTISYIKNLLQHRQLDGGRATLAHEQ